MKKHAALIVLSVVLSFPFAEPVFATPDFAEDTRQGCLICHLSEDDPTLNDTGLSYLFSGYKWPPDENAKSMIDMGKPLRAITGFFHIISAIMWFGTIIYVHLILKPAYAAKGLPKSEVRLGIASILVIGFSGALLTLSRINDLRVLIETRWGTLLTVKISLYLFLVLSATFVLLFLSPRLKSITKKSQLPKGGLFDPSTLDAFDGKEGRPAYIAFKGNVYDVSGLEHWKGGTHFKHMPGTDLTEAIQRAPHGEETLGPLNIVGKYIEKNLLSPAQKTFYVMAYINLAVVFAVVVVIAFWRWGI